LLRSTYHRGTADEPGWFDIHIELAHERFEPGDLLGICTGAAVRPAATSPAVEVASLSTRLVLRPEPPGLIDGAHTWTIPDLRPLVPAAHANDGPVSGWIERSDGTTIELDVVPSELATTHLEPVPSQASSPPIGDAKPNLVPRPATMQIEGPPRSGSGVSIVIDQVDRWPAVAALAQRLGIEVAAGETILELEATIDSALPNDAYDLYIDGAVARLRGTSPTAVTRGMITLAQLVAAGVPAWIHIADSPRHSHRGLSVDLARRWFEPDVVERLIDLAAWRKLSHLQLHLTDDEAWRVPVDAYPALAEVGGVRGCGLALGPLCGSGAAPYGRAYTSAEIGRWVEQAEGLAVELVPEIDIPAHCYAALVALPELGDRDDRSEARSVQGFGNNVLVPGPATTRFLHEVFGSLADLFPNSAVLHLGGDEVPPGAWTQSPRAAQYGRDHGIRPGPAIAGAVIAEAAGAIDAAGRGWAGWQEVARFDHAIEPAYVVAWSAASAIGAVLDRGHRVVASPGDAYYLDMAVDESWSTPGHSWAGSTSLATTCDFDLTTQGGGDGRLIGGQAAIWGEHISSLEVLDELLFPRLDAVAEATWTGDAIGRADDIRRRSYDHPTVLRQASFREARR
jgi:hexosaminidase